MAPTLVLCSRNARPEKGLVRRPHLDQHGCPSKRGSTSELGRNMYIVRCAQGRTVWRLPWGVMECGCLLASCARGTRTMGMCSFDARSWRSSRPLSCEKKVSDELGGVRGDGA